MCSTILWHLFLFSGPHCIELSGTVKRDTPYVFFYCLHFVHFDCINFQNYFPEVAGNVYGFICIWILHWLYYSTLCFEMCFIVLTIFNLNGVYISDLSSFVWQIAYFVEPSHDCLVECLPTCKSENNPPKWVCKFLHDYNYFSNWKQLPKLWSAFFYFARFPPILCHTYLSQRYSDTHTDLTKYEEIKK